MPEFNTNLSPFERTARNVWLDVKSFLRANDIVSREHLDGAEEVAGEAWQEAGQLGKAILSGDLNPFHDLDAFGRKLTERKDNMPLSGPDDIMRRYEGGETTTGRIGGSNLENPVEGESQPGSVPAGDERPNVILNGNGTSTEHGYRPGGEVNLVA